MKKGRGFFPNRRFPFFSEKKAEKGKEEETSLLLTKGTSKKKI
jgi:hypothetical protein